MAKGIIYVTTTIVDGIVKIGKTGSENFEKRMYNLERNGYNNVVGLKRYYAIEVENYSEKEELLQKVFAVHRVENSELFALDKDIVVSLLSSFEGKQIYPAEDKKETFEEASDRLIGKEAIQKVPEGTYHMHRKREGWDKYIDATLEVKNHKFILKAGSIICPIRDKHSSLDKYSEKYAFTVENDILMNDVEFNSPSGAAGCCSGVVTTGWHYWVSEDGRRMREFREV